MSDATADPHNSFIICAPVVFPDLGGPTRAILMGTAGPGDGPPAYFSGLAMKQSLASCEAR